jgi:uncharacterized integral membrane protein
MNESLAASKLRICYKCRFEANTSETKCPKCRRPLFTQTKIRILGGLITFLGAFIAAMMIYILSFVYSSINQANDSLKFTGTETQASYIYAILGLTLTAGLFFVFTGLWQIIFGRRNRILVWISLLIIFGVVIISIIFVSNVKK